MCGIFGFALSSNCLIRPVHIEQLLKKLFIFSESRGKESAGIYLAKPQTQKSAIIKYNNAAHCLLKESAYKKTLKTFLTEDNAESKHELIVLAHSRLVTNGSAEHAKNNQPIKVKNTTVIHNGIIVNIDELWEKHQHLKRTADVDTEILAALLEHYAESEHPINATNRVFSDIQGAASIAWTNDHSSEVTLSTNTGDLYYSLLPQNNGIIFSSEAYILEQSLKDIWDVLYPETSYHIQHITPKNGIYIDLDKNELIAFEHTDNTIRPKKLLQHHTNYQEIILNKKTKSFSFNSKASDESLLLYNAKTLENLKRCTRCILPDTFPFIHFDAEGVCNYCLNYKPHFTKTSAPESRISFKKMIENQLSETNQTKILVPFSGGRDSSYGLHLLIKEFDFKPLTFTYDWGMVTDLARRNISRMCSQLGVQNILVSADLAKKRHYIRQNVSAWLKKPDLGMIPLFMAGDKHFLHVANELKKQTGLSVNIWCANPLENTDFKSGFCGISPDFDKKYVDSLALSKKFKMLGYYFKQFSSNPAYLNTSLIDTFSAFYAYYFAGRSGYYSLFHHISWDEEEVNRTLLHEYDWEISPDSNSTWRIGDGTAPFYNYIYVTAKGFSEFDTFKSNQIREGMLTREEALKTVLEENQPRYRSIESYLNTINLDFNDVIKRVNTLDTMKLHQ